MSRKEYIIQQAKDAITAEIIKMGKEGLFEKGSEQEAKELKQLYNQALVTDD